MQIEASGKSVEIAIQNGLLECGKKREEVEVKVLDQGGLFKKARVELSWKEPGDVDTIDETKVENTFENEIVNESENEKASEQIDVSENVEKEETHEEKPKRVVDTSRLVERGKEFLLGLARIVDENANVQAETKENEISFSITGENLGKLIGYHGDNIQAIQMLLSGLKLRSEWPVRMYVDIGGYKQNKDQAVIDLAIKTADQAVKIERNIHLDPMNAYTRRIVHTTLQSRNDVTTESTGEGEKRHVVIKPIFKK